MDERTTPEATFRGLLKECRDAMEFANKSPWPASWDAMIAGIDAALAAQEAQPAPTRSQRLRDAGYTRRPSPLAIMRRVMRNCGCNDAAEVVEAALAAPAAQQELTDEQIDELIPAAVEMGVVYDSVMRPLQCYGFNISQMRATIRAALARSTGDTRGEGDAPA